MGKFTIEEMNTSAYKVIEEELLNLGSELKNTINEMSEFKTHPENLRRSMLGYSKRLTRLEKILDVLEDLYNKVDYTVKEIIKALYIKNESISQVVKKTGIKSKRLRELHRLIVCAVIEKLGMFRSSYKEMKEQSRYLSTEVKRKVSKRDKGQCVVCGTKEKLHYHHINHFSKGGTNSVENIVLLCASCHAEEHKDEASYYLLKSLAEG